MATVSLRLPPSFERESAAQAAKRPGFWRRLFDAMVAARMRKAQAEIEHYKRLIPTDEAALPRYGLGKDAERLPFVR